MSSVVWKAGEWASEGYFEMGQADRLVAAIKTRLNSLQQLQPR